MPSPNQADGDSTFLRGLLNYPVAGDGEEATYALYAGLGFVQFIIIMVFLLIVPWLVQRRAREADLRRTTIGDFVVQVRNLPLHVREAEISAFFSAWGNVVMTSLLFKTDELRSLKRRINALSKREENPSCWHRLLGRCTDAQASARNRAAKYAATAGGRCVWLCVCARARVGSVWLCACVSGYVACGSKGSPVLCVQKANTGDRAWHPAAERTPVIRNSLRRVRNRGCGEQLHKSHGTGHS